MKQGGITYLFMASAPGRVELLEFNATTRDLTPIASFDASNGKGVGFAAMLVPSADGTALYYGLPDPVAGGSAFKTIWRLDTSNLASWVGTPPTATLVATLPDGCLAADIHPNGARMMTVSADGNTLFDVNLGTGAVTPVSLPASAIGNLRIEPTLGKFHYLTNTLAGATYSDITVLDLSAGASAGSAIGVSSFGAGNPWSVAFHPSGQFAYLIPLGSGTNTLGMLATVSGGAASAVTATGMLPRVMAGYGVAVGANRLYFLGSGDNYDLVTFNLDSAGLLTLDKVFPRESGEAIAMVELPAQPLTVKANIPGPVGPVVQLNNSPPANLITQFVPLGSTHNIGAVALLQPAGATPPGPRFTFLNKWTREPNNCSSSNSFSTLLTDQTMPLAPTGDTYWAC